MSNQKREEVVEREATTEPKTILGVISRFFRGKVRESDWYSINICVKCERRLTHNQLFHSGGICPMCGHDAESTVCARTKVILKEFKHHPRWRFWNKKYTYKGRDEFSERWANGV